MLKKMILIIIELFYFVMFLKTLFKSSQVFSISTKHEPQMILAGIGN